MNGTDIDVLWVEDHEEKSSCNKGSVGSHLSAVFVTFHYNSPLIVLTVMII
jgi:hypothetical protein